MESKNLLLILTIIVIVVIIITTYNITKEHFNNYSSTLIPPIRKLTIPKSENNIWMYWENKRGHKKPAYLQLCYDTVIHHCSKSFNIYLLDKLTILKYLPNLRSDLDQKLNIPPKCDYLRYSLLEKYGGIWLDADTIVMKDLLPIIRKFKKFDFVGFGCHYGDRRCRENTDGYPHPANWVIASRRHGKLMKLCCNACNKILDNDKGDLRNNYFGIGRELIWKQINYLIIHDHLWNYYHYNSKCVERDSEGNKLRNYRSISKEDIDIYCKTRYLFVPIYNTAPGFPEWFRKMGKGEILASNMLISKLFRYSLNIEY